LRLGNSGVARLGGGYDRYRTSPLIGTSLEGTERDSARFAVATMRFDTLDSADFPRRGYVVEGGATSYYYKDAPGDPVQSYQAFFMAPVTFGRLTLTGFGQAGRSRDDRGGFSLGGFLNLSGTPASALVGSQALLLAGLAYYRLDVPMPRALGRNLYAGISLEAGNAWRSQSEVRYDDLRKSASLFLGLESLIGPVYLGYGRTWGGDSAVYLLFGRPTDQLRSDR
jgi:NTE family protein